MAKLAKLAKKPEVQIRQTVYRFKMTRVAEKPKMAGTVKIKKSQIGLNGIMVKMTKVIKMASLIRKPKRPKTP